MNKHNVRCEVCNKFITEADRADDDMCVSCALLIDKAVYRKMRVLQFVRNTLIFLNILAFCVVLMLLFGRGAGAEELYDYKVYGQNKHTGLVVVGHLWEIDKKGNLKAKIYDEMEIKDQCFGAWVGYGVAQVGCENGYQYVLMVVEE